MLNMPLRILAILSMIIFTSACPLPELQFDRPSLEIYDHRSYPTYATDESRIEGLWLMAGNLNTRFQDPEQAIDESGPDYRREVIAIRDINQDQVEVKVCNTDWVTLPKDTFVDSGDIAYRNLIDGAVDGLEMVYDVQDTDQFGMINTITGTLYGIKISDDPHQVIGQVTLTANLSETNSPQAPLVEVASNETFDVSCFHENYNELVINPLFDSYHGVTFEYSRGHSDLETLTSTNTTLENLTPNRSTHNETRLFFDNYSYGKFDWDVRQDFEWLIDDVTGLSITSDSTNQYNASLNLLLSIEL